MIRWRRGEVRQLLPSWPGVALSLVAVDTAPGEGVDPGGTGGAGADRGHAPAGGEGAATTCRALAYTDLVGTPRVGDTVLLNTGALDMGLGTGGYALVVAVPDRLPADRERPGHLVKARYTPLQATVLGADEQGSPHHGVLRSADGVDGMPVVVADLHSALPAVVAGVRAERPDARIVNVMLDGGALPAAFSQLVGVLREEGLIAGCVTTGQAFGGDLEAVTPHSGLLAARHVMGADVAVVCQGPGNLGTGTPWGFSGVSGGEAVNAAAVLGGRPVASLRVSEADPRERHRGVSHHSLTAYGRVALARADVVVPVLPGAFGERVRAQARTLGPRHTLVEVGVGGLEEAILALPVKVSTMGRGLDEDRAAFLSAAAAGRHAAALL
ncbi:DUF3866 family protein [Nocardiopsis sp. CT-R113]|uniref:DUF3866 family protein n=1 Tax=Nocardiopsis codii TaxID=3065942 RepID=A0ABU7KET4_9ACTN|nr:DUF3866 family protein [Nocardiopsis sp. CT-R113]MEE2040740.1 DUF3866 family protein [Nocardiopsis sp. CT-R113]